MRWLSFLGMTLLITLFLAAPAEGFHHRARHAYYAPVAPAVQGQGLLTQLLPLAPDLIHLILTQHPGTTPPPPAKTPPPARVTVSAEVRQTIQRTDDALQELVKKTNSIDNDIVKKDPITIKKSSTTKDKIKEDTGVGGRGDSE
jgi:hypothetical protein